MFHRGGLNARDSSEGWVAVSFQEAPRKPVVGTPSLRVPPCCSSRFNRQTLCNWIWQKGDLFHIFSSRAGVSSTVGWSGPFPVACRGPHRHLRLPTEEVILQVTPFHAHPPISSAPPFTRVHFSRITEQCLLVPHVVHSTLAAPCSPTGNYKRRSLGSAYCLRVLIPI